MTEPLSNGISLTESNNVTEDFLVKSGVISITSDNIDEDFNRFNWFYLHHRACVENSHVIIRKFQPGHGLRFQPRLKIFHMMSP